MEKCCICGRETENGAYVHLYGDTEAVCPSCLALSMDEKAKSARQKTKRIGRRSAHRTTSTL